MRLVGLVCVFCRGRGCRCLLRVMLIRLLSLIRRRLRLLIWVLVVSCLRMRRRLRLVGCVSRRRIWVLILGLRLMVVLVRILLSVVRMLVWMRLRLGWLRLGLMIWMLRLGILFSRLMFVVLVIDYGLGLLVV